MKNKIIIAIDSWKGCLTSAEANQAAAVGISRLYPDAQVLQVPVSDGGEGWLDAFQASWGGERVRLYTSDPLLRPVRAHYLLKGDTAVVEIAQALGLTLLKPKERNPLKTSSFGLGQLMAHAVRNGARHFIVGLGGSATSDCGMGMLMALQNEFPPMDSDFFFGPFPFEVTIATDVQNPLCGPQGAARVFAPQKGATPEMVEVLEQRALEFAEESAQSMNRDCRNLPGAGAAGGLGYAFMQYLGAECRSGVELLLETIHFSDMLNGASLVVTGEGRADKQTLMGKLPFGILQAAQAQGVPTVLLAGQVADKEALLQAGFSQVECINPPGLPLEEAMKKEVAVRGLEGYTGPVPMQP